MKVRTYKYRLYPTQEQAHRLHFLMMQCRHVYNLALDQRNRHYRNLGVSHNYYTQRPMFRDLRNAHPETIGVLPSDTVNAMLQRLDVVFDAFFKKRAGYPSRCKRMNSIPYRQSKGAKFDPASGKWIDLRVMGVTGLLRVRYHRSLPDESKVKQIVVEESRTGKWHACVVWNADIHEQPSDGPPVGVDAGLEVLFTLSNGAQYERIRFLDEADKKRKRAQRALARKKPGSNRRRKARARLARIEEQIAAKRHDYLHNATRDIVNKHSVVCIEDLKTSFMFEKAPAQKKKRKHSGFRRSAADAALAEGLQMLKYKAGATIRIVPPEYTTQTCHRCGEIVPMELKDRVFNCPKCGLEMRRQLNSAKNILARGIAR